MSVTVRTLDLREIRLPLKEPFQSSSGSVETRRILLLTLRDGDGVTSWSECVAGEQPNYSPETVDTAWLAIRDWAAPRLLGHGFEDAQGLYRALNRGFRGHNMAKAAVEMGFWSLLAERQGQSLARLLGGTRPTVPTGISIGLEPHAEALVEKARQAVAAGYRRLKMKIQPGRDVEYLAEVRRALGPEAPLMADANSAYGLADSAHLARLDDLDLLMIEQPLAADDLVRHGALQKSLRTPICLDESITGVDRAEDMLALGSGKIVNVKPGRVGGLGPAKAIHDLCARRGVPVWCGGMLESGIGRAYNVALASLANFTLPGDISPSARYWQRDVVTPEWTMDDKGEVTVPRDRPGIGVDVDLDRIDDLTVRCKTLQAR